MKLAVCKHGFAKRPVSQESVVLVNLLVNTCACDRLEFRVELRAMKADQNYAIGISVKSRFLSEQSDLAALRFAFAYTVTMTNTGLIAAQLISRHWLILDADNLEQEVRGLGVVGQHPLLAPGESFEYTSGCVLATPVGTMKGSYQWTAVDGIDFEAPIPPFILSMPRTLH